MPIQLSELIARANVETKSDAPRIPIQRVVYDSRSIRPGDLYVAVPGFHVDGADFAAAAVAAGASAVIAEKQLDVDVALIVVPDARVALGRVASEIAGNPSRTLRVVGITGTDGKTTTTTMLWAAWLAAGISAAASTTVEYRRDNEVLDNESRSSAPPTTGEAPEIQARLADALAHGCTHIGLETSSHALELHRVEGVSYTGAVFTRITSEHLELHGSVEGYVRAKAHLLDLVDSTRHPFAVLDHDDPHTNETLRRQAKGRAVSYSANGDAYADIRATKIRDADGAAAFHAETPWGPSEIRLQIPGRFNVANALAALAAACLSGADFADAVSGITDLASVNGRMERIDAGQDFAVIVDYAHTADSLEKVLTELRPVTDGQLWVVFGSAGERDLEKRPEMGRVAARLADQIVITDEDPRGEDRGEILEQIAAGAEQSGARRNDNLHLIPDRPDAVAFAVNHAAKGDTILLAGKGHETTLITRDGALPYREAEVARDAIRNRRSG